MKILKLLTLLPLTATLLFANITVPVQQQNALIIQHAAASNYAVYASGSTYENQVNYPEGMFQTPIVLLQSGNSPYLGKSSNYPKVSNNLTALFYGTLQKSL